MSTRGKRRLSAAIALAVTAWMAGCAQAPRTQLPDVPMASAFKEARGPWIEAGASTAAIAFDGWWQGYGDPELDARLAGHIRIVTGPGTSSLYAVAAPDLAL